MHIFTVTTTSDRESWAGNDDEVSAFNLTVSKYFTGRWILLESLYI